ncbi:hypothetical protein OS493_022970 [Desmophyllum pertusum]|uniref:Uncharacterized protein n=1 Tax=Desmophyllum pertusum TaxID=174260 RepID=A0A9W9ZB20_9CNID|nr:hypothetical protein OS493_022970 [Desmophyllum pertusum]
MTSLLYCTKCFRTISLEHLRTEIGKDLCFIAIVFNDFTADGQLAKDWKRLNSSSLLHNNSFWTNPPTMEQFTKDWKIIHLYHDNRFKDETRRINVDINKQSQALLSNKLF